MIKPPPPVIEEASPIPISLTIGLGAVKYLTRPRNPKNSIMSSPPTEKLGKDLNISAILTSTAYCDALKAGMSFSDAVLLFS